MWNSENVSPQRGRAAARELRRLAARPPAGVKLLLRDDDLTDIVALIDGPVDTPYEGGVFRVRLVLGRDFPAAPPRAYFLTRIFHPNVGRNGEVCVNTLKREWRAELGLEHALLALRCLLIAPNADSALNADAAALLHARYHDYFARAKLLTDIHARPQNSNSTNVAEGPTVVGAEAATTEAATTEAAATEAAATEAAATEAAATEAAATEPAGRSKRRARSPRRAAPAPARDKRRILKRL